MIPILDRPDDRESVKYLQEENALLKDACIRERLRTRGTVFVIDEIIKKAADENKPQVIAALNELKETIDL